MPRLQMRGGAGRAELAEAELAEAEPVPPSSRWLSESRSRSPRPEFEAAQLEASGVPIERPNRPAPHPATAHETTEEDAEAAALREALAVVLGNDTGDVPTEDGSGPTRRRDGGAQLSADADNEPPLDWSDAGGDTAGSEATPKRHRHGLLRRFLGD